MVFITLACDGASENRLMIKQLATVSVKEVLDKMNEKNIQIRPLFYDIHSHLHLTNINSY